MQDIKCVTGCKMFTGGEIKHHEHCPYYPESMSKMYDDLRSEVKNLRLANVRLSLLDKVKEIAFGDGSAQERMVDIKALFSNEA